MAGELEEPGWPNLKSSAPDPGSTFLNAFYAVSQVNARKSALQDQIAKLNLQMQKQQFDEQFKEQDFERKSEYQQMMGLLREKQYESTDEIRRGQLDIANQRLDLAQTVAGNKFHQIKDQGDDTDAYAQAVGELRKQYQPGTLDYGAGLQVIRGEHADALNSSSGKALDRGYWQEHASAQNQLGKNADLALKTLKASLANNSKGGGITMQDLENPDNFRTEKGKVYIAETPVKTGPNTTRWQVVPPSEIQGLSTADQKKKYPYLRQRFADKDQFNQWRDLYETVGQYAGGGKLHPDHSSPSSQADVARQILADPDASSTAKDAAKQFLGPNG